MTRLCGGHHHRRSYVLPVYLNGITTVAFVVRSDLDEDVLGVGLLIEMAVMIL